MSICRILSKFLYKGAVTCANALYREFLKYCLADAAP